MRKRRQTQDTGRRSGRGVLFVNHTATVSGAEISMVGLACGLREGGWHPVVVAPGEGLLSDLCNRLGVPYESVPFQPAQLRHPVGIIRNILLMHRVVKSVAPELVHANGFQAIKIAVPLKVFGGPPLVGSIRDIVPFTSRTLRAVALCDAVVCVSHATAEHLLQSFPRGRSDRVHVIYNGVDVKGFTNAVAEPAVRGSGDSVSRRVITCISPLVRWKGQDILLRAMATILGAREGEDVRVLLVGHDHFADPAYLDELHSLAASPTLRGKVSFLGFQQGIPEILAASDIVVVPSVRPDPFPRVVIEAMAAGKPVVASRTGGIPEAIHDGVNGILVPPGEPEALAAAIAQLLANPDTARQLGQRAAEDARERFSMERHVEAMVQLYDSLIAPSV